MWWAKKNLRWNQECHFMLSESQKMDSGNTEGEKLPSLLVKGLQCLCCSILLDISLLDPRLKTGSETSMPLVRMAVESIPAWNMLCMFFNEKENLIISHYNLSIVNVGSFSKSIWEFECWNKNRGSFQLPIWSPCVSFLLLNPSGWGTTTVSG